ncbi:UNVERIFIED_CONTAM: hypothetical protein FKN15_069325, partial [Acipenser sinensis]
YRQFMHTSTFQIIFYEDRNFQGRHYECSSDCADMHSYFNRCNSIRVDSGYWVLYEKPNYMGYQYTLNRGEYPDYQHWMGYNDCIRSCRMIPYHHGNYRMRIYERPDFGGQMMEFMDDCPNVYDRFRYRDINSCNIIFYEDRNFQGRHYECSSDCADMHSYFNRCNSIRVDSGYWVLYEKPNYMGYQYTLNRGEYPDYQRWMGYNDCIRSCRIIPHHHGNYRMRIYERPDFGGQMMDFMDDCPNVYDRFRYRDINSCNVMEGYWTFYEQPNYRGRQYFMRPGEYRRFSDWGGMNSKIGSFKRMRDF